ncbi:putative disease resistance protein RGA1 [Ananas comosus]|uniref:Putative disease resistance protein RGA1 n=1 Tax=Ananas comosus TaxID=4615 RepID=A0A199VF17_ANACO|nr:putative disease resistance protein RGA1 [Ananas comosus]
MTDLSLINLASIELINCKRWEHLPHLRQFSSLQYLCLSRLHAIKQIDCSFSRSSTGCAFPLSKKLLLLDMPNLEEWIGIDDGCMFPQLYFMEIFGCPNLRGIPTLPRSLRRLEISDVGLTALPTINHNCENNNQQEHFQALASLTIERCEKLKYIPAEFFQKFNAVEVLSIEKCPQLTKRGISDIQLPCILDRLTIGRVMRGHGSWVTSLTCLELHDCVSVASLPPTQVCGRWTMLSYLKIQNCKELSSFGGLQSLVSLCYLEIEGCDKLIEVALLQQPPFLNDVGQKENAADRFLKNGELSIDHHALLCMEPLRSLSSIYSLTLSDGSRLTSLPEEWLLQNHAALKYLSITNAVSLQSLPQSMTKLCSFKSLSVYNASLIRSLPDLPTSLRALVITKCHPVLKERCQENIGLDWPKIANIPNVTIY